MCIGLPGRPRMEGYEGPESSGHRGLTRTVVFCRWAGWMM
jgi:hypothetical protein